MARRRVTLKKWQEEHKFTDAYVNLIALKVTPVDSFPITGEALYYQDELDKVHNEEQKKIYTRNYLNDRVRERQTKQRNELTTYEKERYDQNKKPNKNKIKKAKELSQAKLLEYVRSLVQGCQNNERFDKEVAEEFLITFENKVVNVLNLGVELGSTSEDESIPIISPPSGSSISSGSSLPSGSSISSGPSLPSDLSPPPISDQPENREAQASGNTGDQSTGNTGDQSSLPTDLHTP